MIRVVVAVVFLAAVIEGTMTVNSQRKCSKLADIAMVVDESGSIGSENFAKTKTFLGDIVDKFSVAPFGVHFGLVKYSTYPRLVFSLTKFTDAATIRSHIKGMSYRGGGTKTGKALKFTESNIFNPLADRQDVPNVVILFSDGKSHDHRIARKVTTEMKKQGAVVLCVGIGDGEKIAQLMSQLQELASKPEYVFTTSFELMQTIENSLAKEVCEVIDPCKAKPCENNGKCVGVGEDDYKCECPLEYEGPHCELPRFCLRATFTKKGCFDMTNARDQKLLFNDRDKLNKYTWNEGWNNFVDSLVCRCAVTAKEQGYSYFWIEFYGECWGHKKHLDLNKLFYTPKKCWSKNPEPFECNHNERNPICVGVAHTGYLYQLDGHPNTII